METRGVDSVRSPVTTLQATDPSASHEAFVAAVTASFLQAFDVDADSAEAEKVSENQIFSAESDQSKRIRSGMEELKVRLGPRLSRGLWQLTTRPASDRLGNGRSVKPRNSRYRSAKGSHSDKW
jgi:hypothetical protein